MLNAETAAERLEAFHTPDWQQNLQARVEKLPHDLKLLAKAAHHPERAATSEERQRRHSESMIALDRIAALPAPERLEIFTAWFPRCARAMERAWQMFNSLPYQAHYTRKAFRTSVQPEANLTARKNFLLILIETLGLYEQQDLPWFAAWAGYLQHKDALGLLFAAAINGANPVGTLFDKPTDEEIATGSEIFDILLDSARGTHEIGAFGRHVTRALLVASRPDGWEFMEKMLLAAQRQEGLRQVILETIDEAHPEAFRRMLRVILDNDLCRFSAVIRAVNLWIGFNYEAMNARIANATIGQLLTYLEDPLARRNAISTGDGQAAYLALWTVALDDAMEAIPPAADLLRDGQVERRFVAAYLLGLLGLLQGHAALVSALEDADMRVAWLAFQYLTSGVNVSMLEAEGFPDMFERLETFATRFQSKEARELEPLVWPWMTQTVRLDAVAYALIAMLGQRSPKRLLPYMPLMDSYRRGTVIEKLIKIKDQDAEVRDLLFRFAQDKDGYVCKKALEALATMHVTTIEAQALEPLLKRTGSEVRRGVQTLLFSQPDNDALISVERLLTAGNAPQRTAGLDMLHALVRGKRAVEASRNLARGYLSNPVKKTEAEVKLIETMLDAGRVEATLQNGLGLFDPAQLTVGTLPHKHDVTFITPAAIACLKSLDALIDANRETPLQIKTHSGTHESLLGDVEYNFPGRPAPHPQHQSGHAASQQGEEEPETPVPPLNELWEEWLANRPAEERDADGLELERAFVALMYRQDNRHYAYLNTFTSKPLLDWLKGMYKTLYGDAQELTLKYHYVVTRVLGWLTWSHAPANAPDFTLDAAETLLASIPMEEIIKETDQSRFNWRTNNSLLPWLAHTRSLIAQRAEQPDVQHVRLFGLLKWLDQPFSKGTEEETTANPEHQTPNTKHQTPLPFFPRLRPEFIETLRAYKAGAANETDLLDHLIGPAAQNYYGHAVWGGGPLPQLSGRRLPAWCDEYPILETLVARARTRILEVEWERGDLPTAASYPARYLQWTGGMDTLLRTLTLLGKEPLSRAGGGAFDSRVNTFSHLIRAAYPARTDTAAEFTRKVQDARIDEQRLIELALFAPQWAGFVEQTLGWPQLAEAVWWIHAHTKDHQWSVPKEMRDEWTAQSAERTPLSAQSLLDGAVDVVWFHRVYAALGAEKWSRLYEAAKYASGAGGHKRAQLFADAMLGRVEKAELLMRVKDKRNQDALRALGLVPLAPGSAGEADALERYKIIQEFLRTSRQFGAQRQQSEKMAVGTAMENLARTSGYADPARLEWAMEASAVADLANGPVSVSAGDAVITLSINALGKPEIAVAKNGKPLKAIPASAKKDPEVVALQERKRDIDRQASRMRLSLEQAMCRGDRFTARELPTLMAHPVLAPMLRSVVFVVENENAAARNAASLGKGAKESDSSASRERKTEFDLSLLSPGIKAAGYPLPFGRALENHVGEEIPLREDMTLRIAHPYDLLNTEEWHLWQRDCFQRERVQPFKQVFRELYVLTEAETDQKNLSHRYDGHQLNPRQAMALLGGRGWVASYEEGPRRTFHDVNLTACVSFFEGYSTPAEVEGLTVNGVYFTKRGEWLPLPLTQVPPRVFSEAMRDVDLAVSVAHQGGVDPEASASTVEMRASLLRESLMLLKVQNVRFQGSHVLIDGQLGTYSVHLGSAVVHRQPGGALCIVPVHAQHRGRLFLPFADDDPKTAEVISKVLLLANDTQIKDPIILEQILVVRQ